MKLFSLKDASKVSHPDHGEFVPSADGSFDLPHEFAEFLHRQHIGGEKHWETDGERSLRLAAEDEAHRKDPATLLGAVEDLVKHLSNQPNDAEAKKTAAAAKRAAAKAAKEAAAAPSAASSTTK